MNDKPEINGTHLSVSDKVCAQHACGIPSETEIHSIDNGLFWTCSSSQSPHSISTMAEEG